MGRRGLLLDRDGVVNIDQGYVGAVAQFAFMPGLFDFLRLAQDRGFRLAILTNQSGVARGLYSAGDYENLTGWMQAELGKQGISLDLVLACFEHPEASLAAYRRESFWRKPNAGMVLEAIRRLDLDPARSAFLGDQLRDMQAAQAGGIGHCLWLTAADTVAPAGVTIVRTYHEVLSYLERSQRGDAYTCIKSHLWPA